MDNYSENRRKVIKNLLIAGFGLQLVGCTTPPEETTKAAPAPPAPEPITDPEVVEEIVESNNVSYFFPADEEFTELATYFNKHTQKSPGVIALVSNTEGVSEAIKYAIENDLQVSVKSGGHSFEQFSSNIDGLVINLSLLKQMEWEDDLLTLGPGCLLKEIYDEVIPKERILPAGSCGTVGIGGLTLGGGYGFFARKYGLTCDQLVKATIVDGKGNIEELEEEGEALWALRGGGNGNFGVVTSMTFTTHPLPTHFSTKKFKARQLDLEKARTLLSTWFEYAEALPESYFSAFVLNGTTLTVLVTYYEDASPELDVFVEAMTPITDKQTESRHTDIGKKLSNYYGIQHPIYFKNASAGFYENFEEVSPCIDEVLQKVLDTPGLIYQVNTLGGAIQLPEFEKISSFPHRQYPFLSELQSYWNEGQNSKRDRLLSAFEEIQGIFFDNGIRRQYRNYPSIDFTHWEEAYYDQNYSRLQEVKRRFDPDDLIRHEQSIRLTES